MLGVRRGSRVSSANRVSVGTVSDRMRWQYAIANVGTIDTAQRLERVLGKLGSDGWELVNVYDKSSNWIGGAEKGFVLFKRAVLPGEEPEVAWAVHVDKAGNVLVPEPTPGGDVPW